MRLEGTVAQDVAMAVPHAEHATSRCRTADSTTGNAAEPLYIALSHTDTIEIE